MAVRIENELKYGWIDNTVRNIVKRELYIEGVDEPVVLELTGNCHRDLAGRRCTFKNSGSMEGRHIYMCSHKKGVVGDISASQRRRVPEVPYVEYYEMKKQGQKSHMQKKWLT